MRIISGNCRGRKLVNLQGHAIRPTADRTREAVFSILGQKVRKAKVLDLFAGTGALGIEALSRWACHATFIDLACDIIHQNLELCRFKEKSTVISCDIVKDCIPEILNGQQFDLVFIDPPYKKGYIEHTLQKESFTDLLAKDCIIIAEQSCTENLQLELSTLDIYRQKKYSKTIVSFINKI
ncbi:MAG TPA: 16S rRNA (guanine(966)-N(2))-methyltransferase RsmD [Desulfobacterales bacterium]|nr:16S rRNA (guanine(966)-N(2))-methyltransferase RsmD [Deltaproteobacteria bacterium]HGY10996.1 16S rRNA (guanine(966)-N(2))-methyltransferase RsmD [Desulfobacterales bacterium]